MPRNPKQYEHINTSLYTKEELIKLYNQRVKVANNRISTILKTPKRAEHALAYKYEVKVLKGTVYIEDIDGTAMFKKLDKNANINDIKKAITAQHNFLSAKTSTVSGIAEVKRMREDWIEKFKGGHLTKKQRDVILQFLGTDKGKAALTSLASEQVVEGIKLQMRVSKNKSDFEEAFDKWFSGSKQTAEWIRENEEKLKSRRRNK